MAKKTPNPKVAFEVQNMHYRLGWTMRVYQPGRYNRFQIVDKNNDPVTEHLLAGEMNTFLKGTGAILQRFQLEIKKKTYA